MDMSKRTYLKKGDLIRLKRKRHSELHSEDVWKILGIVGEGGSSICYQASCGKKTGRLKEFYPIAKAAGMASENCYFEKASRLSVIAFQ